MSLFDDILKGLPENALLRGKVREAEAENASLTTEIAMLKDENRTLKSDIQKLQGEVVKLADEIHKLTHIETLNETEMKILLYLADDNTLNFNDSMLISLELNQARLTYFLASLHERGYVSWFGGSSVGEAIKFDLTQKALDMLFKSELI